MSSVEQQRYSEEIDIRRRDGGQVSRSYRCELAFVAGRRYKNAVHMRPAMTPVHYWRSITYLPDDDDEAPPPRPPAVRKLYVSGVNCEPRLRVNRRSETAFVFQKALAASATSTLTCQPNAAMWFKSGVDRPSRACPVFELCSAAVPLPERSDDSRARSADLCCTGDSDGSGDGVSGEVGLVDCFSGQASLVDGFSGQAGPADGVSGQVGLVDGFSGQASLADGFSGQASLVDGFSGQAGPDDGFSGPGYCGNGSGDGASSGESDSAASP